MIERKQKQLQTPSNMKEIFIEKNGFVFYIAKIYDFKCVEEYNLGSNFFE